MFLLKNTIFISMFLMVLSVIVLFTFKPIVLFKNGKTIPFGIGHDRTIFSMNIIVILLATFFTLFSNLLLKNK